MEVNDGNGVVVLGQSLAIARFLANRFGWAGADEFEKARVDMAIDQLLDLGNEFRSANYETDENLKKTKFQKFENEALPKHLNVLNRYLENSNQEYLAGNKLTLADLFLAYMLEKFGEHVGNTLDKVPRVKSINEKVSNHPNIAAWREKRPKTVW